MARDGTYVAENGTSTLPIRIFILEISEISPRSECKRDSVIGRTTEATENKR